jgi:hypothetical protein
MNRNIARGSWLAAATIALVACRPELDDDASRVDGPRVLAVRAEPAEARPNEQVTLTALYTDGTRAIVDAPPVSLAWSFCTARRPLAEPGPIDPACLSGAAARPIGNGSARVVTTVPRDACRAFGPDRPLAKAGEPAGRPADPDGTGGFFQPGLVGGGGASPSQFELRIRCTLPSVTQQVALEFEQRYGVNTNPELALVARVRGDLVEPLADGVELHAAPGERIRLRVGWPDCPDATACGGAERYVSYDVDARRLVDRRESLAVSWLTSAGTFVAPRTGRGEGDLATTSENEWIAPEATKDGTLFIVLRDARGGAAFRTLPVHVGVR